MPELHHKIGVEFGALLDSKVLPLAVARQVDIAEAAAAEQPFDGVLSTRQSITRR